MRKNIFLKSAIRQYIFTSILMLLIGVAAFSFVLRTVEYVAVRAEFERLGDTFRSVGYVRDPMGMWWNDVSKAADLLDNSPMVGFSERRVGVEGFLINQFNADIGGMAPWLPREQQLRINDAIFEGILLEKDINTVDGVVYLYAQPLTMPPEFPIHPVGNIVGYPDLLLSGGWFQGQLTWMPMVILTYPIPAEGEESEVWNRIINMQIDETYIFHASYYMQFTPLGGIFMPMKHWLTTMNFVDIIDENEDISEKLESLERNLRAVNLLPVRDMDLLSYVGGMRRWEEEARELGYIRSSPPFRLTSGRLLDNADYINANPVAVIDHRLSWIRGLTLGDTLLIEIPRTQDVYEAAHQFNEMFVRSTPDNPNDKYIIELEIVGIYSNPARGNVLGTYSANYIYIPFSVLPADIDITISVPGLGGNGLPSIWYAFSLDGNRYEYEQRFLHNYRHLIEEMGFHLEFFSSNSRGFWQIVDPIIITITFNAAVFWLVLVLVCALVTFLFVSKSRKAMAIQRAIGFSKTRIISHMLITTFCFTAPGAIIGGWLGWIRAIATSTASLEGISEIIFDFTPAVDLSPLFMLLLFFVIISMLLLMVFISTFFISAFPVLTQLQGGKLKLRIRFLTKPATTKHTEKSAEPPITIVSKSIPKITVLPASFLNRLRNSSIWLRRQILRARVKTILVFLVAMLLVITLGWLQETIIRTNAEIDDLYKLSTVSGEVRTGNFVSVGSSGDDFDFGNLIPAYVIHAVRDLGYMENFFMEAGHFRSFIVAPRPDGTFPQWDFFTQPGDLVWPDLIGYDIGLPLLNPQNMYALDMIFAFNDIDLFMAENIVTEEMREIGLGLEMGDGLIIDFAEGFGPEDFIYSEEDFLQSNPIPVILPDFMLERRGLSPGDLAFIGYTAFSPNFWDNVPVKIIGIHNTVTFHENAGRSIFIPSDAYDLMFRGLGMYLSFRFDINPEFNRYTAEIRSEIEDIIGRPGESLLQLIMTDHELHTLVGIARQTLTLLELIYPLAVVTAIIIAVGLGLLLMLQNAKIAAVIRALGASRGKVVLMLLSEHLIVCLVGVAAGVLVLALLSAHLDARLAYMLLLYISGVLIGAISGLIVIIRRTPMGMLQVKE